MILGVLALALLVGGFGVWSWTARIAGAVVASGQVDAGLARVETAWGLWLFTGCVLVSLVTSWLTPVRR